MIDVSDGQLNAVSDGPEDGRPVVLIHAGIADLRAFAGFWEELPAEERALVERMESLEENPAADIGEIT